MVRFQSWNFEEMLSTLSLPLLPKTIEAVVAVMGAFYVSKMIFNNLQYLKHLIGFELF